MLSFGRNSPVGASGQDLSPLSDSWMDDMYRHADLSVKEIEG